MKSIMRIVLCILCLAVVFNVALAARKKSAKRNRTTILRDGRRLRTKSTTTTEPTTTPDPIAYPFPMLCTSKKPRRAVAEEVTEKCCRKIGVACKQREHIGQPTEYNCVTENRTQRIGMMKCCNKKKKTWRKGKVADGIDCSHKNHKTDDQ